MASRLPFFGTLHHFNDFLRTVGTSAIRNAKLRASVIKEIGKFTLPRNKVDGPYPAGQLFIHKVFAYRGIIFCSFNCRIHEKSKVLQKNDSPASESVDTCFYQVLIHRGDWRHMRMPTDLNAYLGQPNSRGERSLTVVHGMDCVQHEEVLPYTSCNVKPIDHELFDRIFELRAGTLDESNLEFGIRKELTQSYLINQKSWLVPQEAYKETTNGIEVLVITFYLGANNINGQLRHCWRYSIRLENLEKTMVTIRERLLKVFSLNNLQLLNAAGVVGMSPNLTPEEPAIQFSSTINLPQPKGAHMWGKFKLEREDGTVFDVSIPPVVLENTPENDCKENANHF
uniref:ApaG domain-containing protein n=1 Tax=Syphacia muris TaxID=451379 RepID=A0A0N5AY03_9BILA